jgi:cyclomaltodextrinase
LYPWLDHLQWLGVNTILLGPTFQSMSHGYDLVDYFRIDQRLGDNLSFQKFSQEVHHRGMRILLDAVFNHTGRDFFAFQDLLKNGQNSVYKNWYAGVRFEQSSPMGDPFTYNTWDGHFRLPKLNLSEPGVRDYLFTAVRYWIQEWAIDGLRLDAADVIQPDFIQELRQQTTLMKDDFWLMGEVVHGHYQDWANPNHLHSVTNYEAYKGLYSSLNDKNYFEIAYSLQRQFGDGGIYKDLILYNFVDNHDVNRIISQLEEKNQIYLLYTLLFTMPGVPSIYYGSEWESRGSEKLPVIKHSAQP